MFWPLVYCAFFASTAIFARFDASSTFNADFDLVPLNHSSLHRRSSDKESEPGSIIGSNGGESDDSDDDGNLNKPKLWDKYVKRGRKLWNEWKKKTGRDKPLRKDMSKNFDVSGKVPDYLNLEGYTLDILGKLLCTDDLHESEFLEIEVTWPKTGQRQTRKKKEGSRFICTTYVHAGVFAMQSTYRNDLPRGTHFSSIAWWMWYTAVRHRYPSDSQSQLQHFLSTLRYFLVEDIDEDATKEILAYAIDDGGAGEYEFTPDQKGDDAFWALIGCDSGISIMHILTDYKQALGGKGITSLTINYGQDSDSDAEEEADQDLRYVILAKLGEVGSQKT